MKDDIRKGSEAVNISRRDFCKKATLLTGGGAFVGPFSVVAANTGATVPSDASSALAGATHGAVYSTGSDILKVALIGCGNRGTGAANMTLGLEDGVKLVAMADAFRDRIDKSYELLSTKYGDTAKMEVPEEHKFTGLNAYKQAIALADVVILTTPPGFRPAHFREAVSKGKHVFMEKPVATDAYGVRAVLKIDEEAKKKNLSVVVGLQRRYQASYHRALELVQNRSIGEIISGQVYWNQSGLWVHHRKPEETELEYQIRNWFYFNWLCGDHIAEQHIHNIDVANWFLGEYPETAQGMGGREVRTGKEYGQIFDHHFVEFTYPSGVVISSQCRHQPNTWSSVSENFQGTLGMARTTGSNIARLTDRSGRVIYNHDGLDDPNPYVQEMADLIASIRNGKPIDDTEIGAKATLSAIMGRMATYTGQLITWDDALNADDNLVPDPLDWDTPAPVHPDGNGFYPVPVPGQTRIHRKT